MLNGLLNSQVSPLTAPHATRVQPIERAPALLEIGDRLNGKHGQQVSSLDSPKTDDSELKEAFDDFVGQTFYSIMLKQLRASVGEPAYFHGGRAEEVFQAQLDQIIAEDLSDASGDSLSGSMFELFQLRRQ